MTAVTQGADDVDARELVAGVPHAVVINASFSDWCSKELNRFNRLGRGAWYAALTAVVDHAELFASFAGVYVDLRGVEPVPACLDPDPARGAAGNALADATRSAGYNGIVYPSVRPPGGTCLVALRPQAV